MVDISQTVDIRQTLGKPDRRFALLMPRDIFVPRQQQGVGDFTNAQVALMFIALAAIASVPVVLFPWPPLADYINHLARVYVISAIGSDPDLARFYEINWQVIPN